MMARLGIRVLRPGRSPQPGGPNAANYDESKANPFPDYPELLRLKDGRPVTTPELWWKLRRPEILEDFEREVYGRVPPNAPPVRWDVVRAVEDKAGPFPVVVRELRGRAANPDCPALAVEIRMVVVTPAWVRERVPMMIRFGRPASPSEELSSPPPGSAPEGTDPPASVQLIGSGWGYAWLDPATVQPDHGAGLAQGIIGLANCGHPRDPEDWGALRAWAWGASRALDYFETDPAVDSRRVGIAGVSRFGKAALLAMAFDTRFAFALVGSSGAGGAKPFRRDFGEALENLAGPGQYHWMAGNFLKYAAAEATFGSRNASDLPVDTHMLIALCAPRLTFISYGTPEKGDPPWVDQRGSFMAAVAAGAVYRLLGARDLGIREDYRTAQPPPVNAGLLAGHLAWRQHDGGHTIGPNWKYFIAWSNKLTGFKPPSLPVFPCDTPVPRTDVNSLEAHAQLVRKARQGRIDVYFVGDSIVRRWGATDYPHLLANWKSNFLGWNAANFGWGADRIQNILWRLANGELDGVNPRIVVLQAGTNNVAQEIGSTGREGLVADVTRGIEALLWLIRSKAPRATIVLTTIFPRNDNMALMPVIYAINQNLARLADGKTVRFLNINHRLADSRGVLFEGMMNADLLHPAEKAYQIWADALKPIFRELLGPPASEDHAPPPTGDPKAFP